MFQVRANTLETNEKIEKFREAIEEIKNQMQILEMEKCQEPK